MEKQSLLNTYVDNISMDEAIRKIENKISKREKSYVVAVNVDVAVKIENDAELKSIIDNADIALVDGKPLIWISKIHKKAIKHKISGSDLVPKLCEISAIKGYSLFILGGKDGVAELAKKNIEKEYHNVKIVGTYSPVPGFERDNEELTRINCMINEVKPDILIVCLGCPKQEKWISNNYTKYDACVSICAGATVDFMAGSIKRAPKWMSNCGLEWLYRFMQEPRRLFKRYFIDDFKVFKLIWKYR